jgi:hypothetical protein
MEGLTLAYMFEKAQGTKSPWFPFLQTIDRADTTQLPRFWSPDEQALLKGTEVDALGGLDVEEVKAMYEEIIAPFMAKYDSFFSEIPEYLTYDGFVRSLVEVCGRAFEVDNFRGLSLVPGACMFNHSDKEHVHFESQGHVCDECGALDYCEHLAGLEIDAARGMHLGSDESDGELEEFDSESTDGGVLREIDDDVEIDNGINGEHESEEEDGEDTCTIISVRPIKAGEEVMNTYGDYGNGILLSRYGFAILNNTHEVVDVQSELLRYVKQQNLQMRVKWWTRHAYRAIFGWHPQEYDPSEMDEEADPELFNWKETLIINYDGAASKGLRLVTNILTMSPAKFRALRSQTERGKYSGLPKSLEKSKVLKWIISKRLSCYGDGNLTAQDYLKLISETTGNKKTAMMVVASEKFVLERALASCK